MSTCTATTVKDKRRCKKKPFCPQHSTLCKQHWLLARGPHEPPWVELGLRVEPHAKLSAKALAKLTELLYRGPNAAADKPGHIYQFVHAADHPSLYKIGYTHRTPERRLAEWTGAKLHASWAVPEAAHFAESIIHVLLDHWRVYRYTFADPDHPGERHALSIWKQTGTIIEDAEYHAVRRGLRSTTAWCPPKVAKAIAADAPLLMPLLKANALAREKEWFLIETDYVRAIVEAVVLLVQDWTLKHVALLRLPHVKAPRKSVHTLDSDETQSDDR